MLKMVRWERLYRGWYKLNTDGYAIWNPGVAVSTLRRVHIKDRKAKTRLPE